MSEISTSIGENQNIDLFSSRCSGLDSSEQRFGRAKVICLGRCDGEKWEVKMILDTNIQRRWPRRDITTFW